MTSAQVSTQAAHADPDRMPSGLARILGSLDHKVIGRLYIGTALMFGLGVTAAGSLFEIGKKDGNPLYNSILSNDQTGQVVSFFGTGVILLFLLPLLLGIALVVVPLQLGSRSVAFPRAAAASYWTYALSGVLACLGLALNGGPGGGDAEANDLWVIATGVGIAGLVLCCISLATTVLTSRAEDMTLSDLPMFAWAVLCASVTWILTLPVGIALSVVLFVDHSHGQTFIGGLGSSTYHGVYKWLVRPPQIYVLFVPVLGWALDAVTAATGRALKLRGVAQGAIAAFAFFGIGAVALQAKDQPVTNGMLALAPLPILVLLVIVALSIKESRPKPTAALAAAFLTMLLSLMATMLGVASLFSTDRLWVMDEKVHLHLTAVVVGVIGALYFWAPKIIGRIGNEAAHRAAPLLVAFGGFLVASVEVVNAWVWNRSHRPGVLDPAVMAGIAAAAFGAVIAVVGLTPRRSNDEIADNPWSGLSLEWATASPPAFDNFAGDVPTAESAASLATDQKDGA